VSGRLRERFRRPKFSSIDHELKSGGKRAKRALRECAVMRGLPLLIRCNILWMTPQTLSYTHDLKHNESLSTPFKLGMLSDVAVGRVH
jgi:hypothetical protein